MKKQKMGSTVFTFPMPVVLLGSMVDDKPNVMAVAWCSIACLNPVAISVTVNTGRYTFEGIQNNKTFSVNVPSVALMQKTDFCGIYSGRKVDKTKLFNYFYGELKTAPLIEECPLNIECELLKSVNIGSHDLIVGTVKQVHADAAIIENNKVNPVKMNPFLYIPGAGGEYYALGEHIGTAFSAGKTNK